MHHIAPLLVYLSVSLVLALVLGLVTERLRLSPIVGYLLTGVILGPHTAGLTADIGMAGQIAEVGVILLMFGVGLHFNLRDLWAVRRIALPGAVGQIAIATLLGIAACRAAGLSTIEGVIVGLAISVASTVVLIRVLVDNNVLDSHQGHIAVGWLIVEDVFTVLALVALPALARVGGEAAAGDPSLAMAIVVAVGKMGLLAALVLGAGERVIPLLLAAVARTRSRELFTLCILALALAIATGSAYFFDVSMALGAFLAGMVVGQTEVSHQAAADALPMRDAFAVLFFVAVGMLFEPHAIVEAPFLLALLLVIVLVAKPLAALVIVWLLRYSWHSAVTIAVALAQIGEFSFLLAETAHRLKLIGPNSHSLLVACAMISITLNPLLFRGIDPLNRWLRTRPALWKFLSGRAEARGAECNTLAAQRLANPEDPVADRVKAVIVGYGPVGQTSARILRDFNIEPIVVDLNLDTIRDLSTRGELAVYGDATRRDILEAASIREAKYLLATVPDVLVRTLVILTARELNEEIRVFARARYLKERAWLEEVGATQICIEEAETAVGLAVLLLNEVGADQQRIRDEVQKLHAEYGVNRPSVLA
ncbi:MAG TPA: cation:proton antiporter [Lacipirellulaceae bacterium]|nr:cation:proton antiporter [Lacipirellulaceae bacterium]